MNAGIDDLVHSYKFEAQVVFVADIEPAAFAFDMASKKSMALAERLPLSGPVCCRKYRHTWHSDRCRKVHSSRVVTKVHVAIAQQCGRFPNCEVATDI
jgi:hypothetical protein